MIQHILFCPFIQHYVNVLEIFKINGMNLIKYIISYNDHTFFFNAGYKIDVISEFDV